MTENVYNIIWADDQIDDILTDSLRSRLEGSGIHILQTLDRSEALLDVIQSFGSKVNAVIVDANFPEDKDAPESERDLSGLSLVRTAIIQYRDKIPFILYSQRDTGVLKKDCPWITKEFKYGVNWIGKDADKNKFIGIIKAQIEKYNSPEFRVRCQYRKEFEAAELIPGAEKLLIEGLLYEYNGNWESTEDYFNPARKIIERVFTELKNREIIPDGISKLNERARFVQGKEVNGFVLVEQIMHKTLQHSLQYFLDITNDGSHGTDEIRLEVDEYVRTNENVNLYRSILYIAMDILLWYKNLTEEREGMGVPWKANFEYYGTIEKRYLSEGKSVYYSGECELMFQDNEKFKEGSMVLIRSHSDNTKEDRKAIGLKYFCTTKQYDILDE